MAQQLRSVKAQRGLWTRNASVQNTRNREKAGSSLSASRERFFAQFAALPLQPGPVRATTRRELVRGQVWALEQAFGVLDVLVNIRMTLVKLSDGSLLAYAPIAPTRECRRLVDELGTVSHILLPTTAVEHKVLFGPFANAYPNAHLWAVPRQWSWPINLPLSLIGLFPRKANFLNAKDPPFINEVDVSVLDTPLGLGPYVEAACFHKKSKTLLLTDAVIEVQREPPEVCTIDTRALTNRARDDKNDVVEPNSEGLRKGWLKTVLFALYFQPGKVSFNPIDGFTWMAGWFKNAQAVTQKLIVPPILQTLVLNKRPSLVAAWIDDICKRWAFKRVVPAHFGAPINATPRDLRAAFSFLPQLEQPRPFPLNLLPSSTSRIGRLANDSTEQAGNDEEIRTKPAFPDEDIATLKGLNKLVVTSGVIKPE